MVTTARTTARTIARTAAKVTAAVVLIVVATLGLLLATGTAQVYDATNAGIVVANVGGFEWKGAAGPGFFSCAGQC
jgi:hypothetical protein